MFKKGDLNKIAFDFNGLDCALQISAVAWTAVP